jgi:small conductance mechanosensitive channel
MPTQLGGFFDRWLEELRLEPPVRLARLLVIGVFLIMALQNLGVDLLPLNAGLGVAGAGLTIIFTKPFRVGEYVAMVGIEDRVEAINLFSTRLSHPDRSLVVVPNRKIVGETRQLDLRVEIAREIRVIGGPKP